VSDPAFIAPVETADLPLRRFTQRVAEIVNALTRSGQLTRSTAAELWKVVAGSGTVTNAQLANMATARFKGRVTAGTGVPEDLTGTQATTLLDTFTSLLKGLAPASGGGTANFLRADGTWAAPPGGGGSSIYTAPVLANFAFVNQGAATATTTGTSGAVWVTKPTQGGSSNITQLVRAVPGATWTLVWGYRPACGVGATSNAGIGPSLYESGSGKLVIVGYGGHIAAVPGVTPLSVANFTNATTGSSVPFALRGVGEHRGGGGGYFLKVVNDGTDLRFSYGPDLDVWVEFYTQTLGSFLTPDKVGFHVDAYDDTAGAQLFHHTLTSP
jgi:hypothetical protein